MKTLILITLALFMVACSKDQPEYKSIETPRTFHLGDRVIISEKSDFYYGCTGIVYNELDAISVYDAKNKTWILTPRYLLKETECPGLKNIKGMKPTDIQFLKVSQENLNLRK